MMMMMQHKHYPDSGPDETKLCEVIKVILSDSVRRQRTVMIPESPQEKFVNVLSVGL